MLLHRIEQVRRIISSRSYDRIGGDHTLSLTAGSIFVFPLYGPTITKKLGLSMSQTNAVAVGAIVAESVLITYAFILR